MVGFVRNAHTYMYFYNMYKNFFFIHIYTKNTQQQQKQRRRRKRNNTERKREKKLQYIYIIFKIFYNYKLGYLRIFIIFIIV